jgi:hypothetical protein
MSDHRRNRFPRLDPGDVIPDGWSTDETLLVYDFLLRVLVAISDRYEDQILAGPRDAGGTASDVASRTVTDKNDVPF